MKTNTSWSRELPFTSTLTTCKKLTPSHSKKTTLHISLNLQGSDIQYQPGDSIGVIPTNSPLEVGELLKRLGNPMIDSPHGAESMKLKAFLSTKANISTVSKKVVQLVIEAHKNEKKRKNLELLISDHKKFKEKTLNYRLWDFLKEHPEASLDPQSIANCLTRLIPRLYSIASSQNHVGNEVHLTVALVDYISQNQQRLGVCSRFLYEHSSEGKVPIYLKKTRDFLLPKDPSKNLIMIGPGTGIAPFRAFMQERLIQKATGKHWLFFGDWHEQEHFYYKEEWLSLVKKEQLRLETAFSRDQAHKIYVQDKMKEHSQELWKWIQSGAILYVCGDAFKMAKDVDLALKGIAQKEGSLSEEEAQNFLKNLRKERRYLRDIY